MVRDRGQIERALRDVAIANHAKLALLFGSWARNTQTAHSDVDAIFVEETDDRFIDRLGRYFDPLTDRLGPPVEVLVYTPDEFARMKRRPFVARALKEGIVVSQRWLKQAQADLRGAQASHAAASFEWACFQSQQAAEKAMKALWFRLGHDPWGHSVMRLMDELPDETTRQILGDLRQDARDLDKLYIPTRYPNGLPEMTPSEAYGDIEAIAAIEAADRIIAFVRDR
jgi:HEPN domain-containing protein/predicted nucleotidyltransferase